MTIDAEWNLLVEKLLGSLKTSETAQIKSNQEDNVSANKQLKERTLLNSEKTIKPKAGAFVGIKPATKFSGGLHFSQSNSKPVKVQPKRKSL